DQARQDKSRLYDLSSAMSVHRPHLCPCAQCYEFFFSSRFFRCAGWTINAMPILNTYNAIIGAANTHIFRMSVVGVRVPATTKIPKTKYRRFRHIHPAVTMPIRERKKTRIGISKITPNPMITTRKSELYSPRVIMG